MQWPVKFSSPSDTNSISSLSTVEATRPVQIGFKDFSGSTGFVTGLVKL
jgi:hypothetical protein